VRTKLVDTEFQNVVTHNTLKNVSSFLWQLAQEGHIKVQEKGSGQRPSVYVKTE
jgi:hypothetical protein